MRHTSSLLAVLLLSAALPQTAANAASMIQQVNGRTVTQGGESWDGGGGAIATAFAPPTNNDDSPAETAAAADPTPLDLPGGTVQSSAIQGQPAHGGRPLWPWLLLSAGLLGAVGWGFARKRTPAATPIDNGVTPVQPPVPSPVSPTTDADEPALPQPEIAAPDPAPAAEVEPSPPPLVMAAETSPEPDVPSEPETMPESEPMAESPTVAPEPEAPPEPPTPPPTDPTPPRAAPPATDPFMAGAADLAAGAGAAGLATGTAAAMANTEDQSIIEASKYNVVGRPITDLDLSTVDQELTNLPQGYGESRIVLLPRDPHWAYAYWDTPHEHKEQLRRQGGERLALRLYDVTNITLDSQNPHSLQQYDCEEMARDWYLPIPISDRNYLAEIGYLTGDGRWLVLARSNPIHVPPVYPSDWTEDQFLTVDWDQDLRSKTLLTLTPPDRQTAGESPIHEDLFALAQAAESIRLAGSLFGSMQHVPGSMAPQQGISSYVFPSGMGLWALPTASGALPTLSGIGFAASQPPIRPRHFWLVADAELIVYGATEPDATVTIAGQSIKLNENGTFRFQLSFQDGVLDYPVMAVARDGEQNRSIHMSFERETPERNTNTREEAQDEWPTP